jgi:hypothetical protein
MVRHPRTCQGEGVTAAIGTSRARQPGPASDPEPTRRTPIQAPSLPDQSIPVAGRVHAHRPAAGNPEPAADPAPRIAVIRRVRDFAALGGEEAGGSKCIRGDDPVPYLLTVTPSGPEKLFFETVVVTLLIDKNPGSPANPVVTLTDTGKVVRTDLNGYAELPLDRRLKALPSELAKQILANWLDKFPPLLTSSQIEDRRKLYDRKVEIKHIKEVDRKRLDRNRLQLVLDQYDEEKGFLRKMRGDSPFVGALKGFIARIAGSALTDDEIEDLQLLMLKHNDVLLDSTSLSAEIYTELTKAIAEATDDTVYKSLLASHVKIPEYFEIGISSDQVFIDSTGQAQDVSQVRMLLEENVAFVNPVTKGPFDEKDIKRLCGYPSINLTIRSIENSLRDQKGRISAATVKEITKLIGPMDGFNKSPDGPNRWALAAAAFSEYASSLDHKSQTNLWTYRISIGVGTYTGASKNSTFKDFFDMTVKECNNASADRLRTIVNLMKAGTGGEAEADRWRDLAKSAVQPRIGIPEYQEEPRTTTQVITNKVITHK